MKVIGWVLVALVVFPFYLVGGAARRGSHGFVRDFFGH